MSPLKQIKESLISDYQSFATLLSIVQHAVISRCVTLNRLRVNIKHFIGPILGTEVAQKRAPFSAVVTITEMGNANLCILCDAVKKVE